MIRDSGFKEARLCDRFDSFLGTNKEGTARKFGVFGANFMAYK